MAGRLRPLAFVGLAVMLAATTSIAQTPVGPPPLGPLPAIVDEVGGTVVVPTLAQVYEALGQNVTREDVRILVDLNVTKGAIGVGGLLLGSGNVEVQAAVHVRVELRVISSDRIKDLIASGTNATFENLTFLEEVYLPAEAFRASLTAEGLAAFQAAEERFLRTYLSEMVPELQILGLDLSWANTLPTGALTDLSLTEPPIVVELDMTASYLRVESIPSLLEAYLASAADPGKEGRDAYIERIKMENAAPRARRDFLGGAAYDQLLNLSMQPGWSLDLGVHLPRGYEFTYFSDEARQADSRSVDLHVDASSSDEDVQEVFVASITQPRAVALALLAVLLLGGSIASAPGRLVYWRWRLPRLARRMAALSGPRPRGTAAGASEAEPTSVAKASDGAHAGTFLRNLVQESRAEEPGTPPRPGGPPLAGTNHKR